MSPTPLYPTHSVSDAAARRRPAPGPKLRRLAVDASALAALLATAPLAAQEIGSGEGARFGISFGGISTIGFTAEYFRGHRSVEITVGTWSFRDLSLAVAVKEYLGAGSLHPFVGGGLWLVGAMPKGERLGLAAVLQAPIGVDWRVVDHHALGFVVDVNRALAVRRTDPLDKLPLNRRLVPLPGVYYRWTR